MSNGKPQVAPAMGAGTHSIVGGEDLRQRWGQETTLAYDNLGRLKTRTTPEGTNTWTYYYQGGKFNNNVVSVGIRSFTYSNLGLMQTGYGRTYTYDSKGKSLSSSVDDCMAGIVSAYCWSNGVVWHACPAMD